MLAAASSADTRPEGPFVASRPNPTVLRFKTDYFLLVAGWYSAYRICDIVTMIGPRLI